MPDPPAGLGAPASSTAVALGPGNSVLVATAGDDVVIGGAKSMTTALLSDKAAQASPGAHVANPWMRVGAVPAVATFSDSFTSSHLDNRWTRSDPGARTSLSASGLMLVPGMQSVAALTQAASAGDAVLTVEVARPAGMPADGSVGLVMYQDDGDWLTLTVNRAGTISLCPMAQQVATPCVTAKASASASVWLRMQRSGGVFTAFYSADGSTWQRVGQWSPASSGTASAAPSPTTTATVTTNPTSAVSTNNVPGAGDTTAPSLVFTAWGVVALGDGQSGGWPHLTNFSVVSVS